MDWLPRFVNEHLTFTGKCFRHCDKPTAMKSILQDPTRVVGAYICPDAFVSQLVYFSQKPDLNWFTKTIVDQVGGDNFSTNDVRTASRHGWELGGNARQTLEAELGANSTITEVYWTRYPRTEDQKRVAISLCIGDSSRAGCLRLFPHDRDKVERFCARCGRAKSARFSSNGNGKRGSRKSLPIEPL